MIGIREHCCTIFYLVLDSLNDYLRDVYKETRYSHHTEWPPDQPKSVVSNTLIHYKDKRTERELLDMSKRLRGASSVDEITSSHPSRVTKSITSIFELPNQKFILIEGAPGIGKTVLVKEIACQWACGEILQGKKLFLLFVRNPTLHGVDSIDQQLISSFSCDYLTDSEVGVAVDELRKSRGKNIVFVIDGFDECPHHCQLKRFIEKLARHEILPKSMVIITSRPHASISLRPLADQRIEILGFAKEEREKYIAISFNEFSDKLTELKKYLKLQPIINSIMHVPFHLAVLLYLFKEGSMPETLTELNEQFVIHTIYRYLEKHHLLSSLPFNKNIERIKDLPKPIIKSVDQLSKLALKGLWRRQIVFSYNEVEAVCTNIDEIPNAFGLLQTARSHSIRGAGPIVSFNFLHLTMQEFLAAYYVSILPSEEQLRVAFDTKLSNYVWLMYVGIVGIISDSFVAYQERFSKGILPIYKLLMFQFYLEAKKLIQVPKNITSMFQDGKIEIARTQVDPYTMASLVNFIAKSDVQVRLLNLHDCCITDEEMSILQGFSTDYVEKTSCLKHVCLSKNYITSLWGVDSGNITSENSKSGLLLIPCLNIFANKFKDSGILELFVSLHYNTSLLQLDISDNGLTSNGAVAISECLKKNNTLQVLNISQNKLLDDGIIAISDSLKTYNTALLQLDISEIGITSSGAVAISECLKKNNTLQVLNISENKLSDDGVIAISNSLKTNQILKTLNLANNRITTKGAAKIADAMKSNKSLSDLNISRNFIEIDGIMNILLACTQTRALQKLDCMFNTLSQFDFLALTNYNRQENVVQVLNTSWNKICYDTRYTCRSKICTTICYGGGHDIQSCKHDRHCNEPYDPHDPYYNRVIYCCIKDVERLDLSGDRYRGRIEVGFASQYLTMTAKAIQVNKALTKLRIELFRVDGNEVQAINDCLKVNTLKELTVSDNRFTNGALKKIIEAVKYNTALRKLDISSNVASEDDMESISVCLKHNKTLQELIMASSKITDSGAVLIAEVIKINTTLLVLDISCNEISDVGAVAIGDSLKYNNQLQELNMSHNYMVTKNGALHLIKFINTNATLVKLSMNYYFLNCYHHNLHYIYYVVKPIHIINCLKNNRTLQEIDGYCDWSDLVRIVNKEYEDWIMSANELNYFFLRKATINDRYRDLLGIAQSLSAIKIINHLLNNKVLQELKLFYFNLKNINRSNNLKFKGSAELQCEILVDSCNKPTHQLVENIIKMIEIVKVSTTLNTLIINNCLIGDDMVAIISGCITHNTSIKELDLSQNSITSKEAVKIFQAIEVNNVIHKLNISKNEISDDGASAISECLSNNTILQHLNIQYNNISHEGISVIIDSLKSNTKLVDFFIHVPVYPKGISHENANKLAAVLQTNLNLRTLSTVDDSMLFVSRKKNHTDTFSFNRIVLLAIYSNKSLTELLLPGKLRKTELCVLQNEVENINIRRQSQKLPIANVNFFRVVSYDDDDDDDDYDDDDNDEYHEY